MLSSLHGRRRIEHPMPALTMAYDTIYRPLPSGSQTIRLLELVPGKWTDDIKVQLREVTIAKARDHYVAISYTWGQAGTVKQVLITCDRARVPVSENLYTILRRLRRPDVPVFAWADALCINQQDPSERTHQVGMMSEIYRNSRETVIWLGEQGDLDDTGDFALDPYITQRDLSCLKKGGPPRVAWKGSRGDQRLLNAYLANMTSSDGTTKRPNDILGAFCLIQSFAQGTSRSFLKFLEEAETVDQYCFLSKSFRYSRAVNGVQSNASRVWAGLDRLMSRPWVGVTFSFAHH